MNGQTDGGDAGKAFGHVDLSFCLQHVDKHGSLLVQFHGEQAVLFQCLEHIAEALEAQRPLGKIGIGSLQIGLEDAGVNAVEAVLLVAVKLLLNNGAPVFLAQLGRGLLADGARLRTPSR